MAILELLYLPYCLSLLPTYGSLPLGVADVLVFKVSPRSRGLEWTMSLLEELCRGSPWRICAPEDLRYSAQDYGGGDFSQSWTSELWTLP